MLTFERRSTPSLVARTLREEIVAGRLRPGEPVRQDILAATMGVSKIPFREALRRLEAEGFVVFHDRRGAVVASISTQEVLEAFAIRLALEPVVLKRAMGRATKADIVVAEKAITALDAEQDPSRWGVLNWEFHRSLYKPAHRPLSLKILKTLHRHIDRFLRFQMMLQDGKPRSKREHMAILRAYKAGDSRTAVRELLKHITGVEKIILDFAKQTHAQATSLDKPHKSAKRPAA